MTSFHFITVVWGRRYTQSLLEVVLPSQLSPGNLPGLRERGANATYKLYTTSADADVIRKSPIFGRLSGILPVEFVLIDDVLLDRKYEAMTESHRRAIRSANAADAALVFLAPDLIFPDGTFDRVRQIRESGKRVILHAGLRVVKETFVPWYLSKLDPQDPLCLALSSRDLVRAAMNHLHPFARSLYWGSESFNRWPANIYWPVGDEGLAARGFHLHPLMIHPTRKDVEPLSTIDDEFLPLACPDREGWHVVRDSDEITVVDITDLSEFSVIPSAKASEFGVAFWMHYYAKPHHRWLATHPIRIHSGGPSAEWGEVEKGAARTMASIEGYLRHPYLLMGWKMVLRALTFPLRKPLKMLLGQNRIERWRRAIGI
jgi:hypothetical protein